MRKTTGIILIFIVILAAGVVGYKFLLPMLSDRFQRETSDASEVSETIRIAGDNYLGYWFISSPEMKKQAARAGIEIVFTDDGGAYADRLQKFANKAYDCIVLPVNSYLQHGEQHKYPGVIVASISESKGADGIIGFSDKVPTGKVNELNNADLTFVFTRESPSEFLIHLTIADFGLDQLRNNTHWADKVDSSKDVYERAKDNQGDIFALWEPDLSKALELPGMKYVWGSDNFTGYIIDVFVFHRDFIKKKRGTVLAFLRTYYRSMGLYRNNREKMIRDMGKVSRLKKNVISLMLDKIDWYDLRENVALQFGISKNVGDPVSEGIVDTIIACTDVMIRMGTMAKDPLKSNPYRIIDSSLLEELLQTTSAIAVSSSQAGQATFTSLDASGWSRLREVGTMRIEPIAFQTGRDRLDDKGKKVVDQIAQMLKNNYPSHRVVIRGHTAPGRDENQNIQLSQRRAEVVLQYLKAVHNINPNRLRAEGLGSNMPPQKKPGESPRAYRYRLARVEFVLVEANPL